MQKITLRCLRETRMMTMVVFVLVARRDHGHVKVGKDASNAGDVGGGRGEM